MQTFRTWTVSFIVVHDPQPAALLSFLDDGSNLRAAKWIWRCHIDLATPRPEVCEFVLPLIDPYDATIWTMPEFVPHSPQLPRVEIFPPAIDPLVPKNLQLAPPFIDQLCRLHGIDPSRPLLCQVSRFDPWKDPIGVIEACRLVQGAPNCPGGLHGR